MHLFVPGELVKLRKPLEQANIVDYETQEICRTFFKNDTGIIVRKDTWYPTLILTSRGHLGVVSHVYLEKVET